MKIDFCKDGWCYTTPIWAGVATTSPQEVMEKMLSCQHEYKEDKIPPCGFDDGTVAFIQRCEKCGAVRGRFQNVEAN